MSGSLSLNGVWSLFWAEGRHLVSPEHLMGPVLEGREPITAEVPGPVHRALQKVGLLDDVNIGLNSLRARWVEEQFWVYRRAFSAPATAAGERAWLVFEKIEYDAVVLLNGAEVGRHANANRPARFEVTGHLRAGENLLVVRVAAGLHATADKPGAGHASGEIGLLTKRHWHRRPQYQFGWDWSARLLNVGLLGSVRLEWRRGPLLDQLAVFATVAPDLRRSDVHVRAFVENPGDSAVEAVLRARIAETGQEASLAASLPPGPSRHELVLPLENPRLWWPLGHGDQPLYTVEAALESGGETQRAVRRTGVRRVEIDQSPHPVEGRYFILRINNRPVFCKGGNLVPADLLYSTVDAKRWGELVDLAAGANFNLLRIWGGGHFLPHELGELCDARGMMIWHDLLFACAKYPGDDAEFLAEVRREVAWAARELAHHCSLVVWCGNNEIEMGDWGWGYERTTPTHPHYALFHLYLPRIVPQENPSAAYWISSPYSPDGKPPTDPTVGDQHPWKVSLGTPGGADGWEYRGLVDRFPNEGGVLGASSPATLRQFLPEDQRRLFSAAWEHHDNPFAACDRAPGKLGHAYQTVSLWTDLDPRKLDWERYAFVSALLQAEGLQEYVHNFRRRMFSSAAAVFWMYNDSWPVTHGWTIVDYYRRRKLSYHPVRRAFAPVTVVVAEEGGTVTVYGVNDTPDDWSGGLRWGLFLLEGGLPLDRSQPVTLPANASTPLARFPRSQWEALGLRKSGAFALLLRDGRTVAQHRLLLERFKDLEIVRRPAIDLRREPGRLTLACPAFAWGVCLDTDGEKPLADDCFDLLPGIPYSLPWDDRLGRAEVRRTGNADALS